MNGYISIELGGKTRGLKFGNRALLDVMAKHQVSEGIKFSFELVADLIYFGLLNNCMVKREDPDFTEQDIPEWVDDMPMDKLLEVFQAFQNSYLGKEPATSGSPKKIATTTATKKK